MMAVLSNQQGPLDAIMGMADQVEVETVDSNGQTAIHLAVTQGNNTVCEKRGPVPCARRLPMSFCFSSSCRQRQAIEKLCSEAKASLTIRDKNGLTPVHLAAIYNRDVSYRYGHFPVLLAVSPTC